MKSIFSKPGDFADIATINIVPIVGLLAALMVLFMVTLPIPTRQIVMGNALGCFMGDIHHTHAMNMHVLADAQATETMYKENYPAILSLIQQSRINSNHSVHVF